MNDITVLHGDCLDLLPTLEAGSVDLVITSPPYNLGNTSGGGMPGKGGVHGHYSPSSGMKKRGGMGKWSGGDLADGYANHDDNMPHDEYVAWQQAVLRECWRLLSDTGAIFYNHKPRILNGKCVQPTDYVPPELPVRQVIIWARAGGINFSPAFYLPTHEWVVLISKPGFRLKSKGASGVGDVWMIAQETGLPHPAPFPLKLPLRILETAPGDVVLDPFAGIGTTGVAALKSGRRAILIEKSERYLPEIHRRLAEAAMPMFDAEPKTSARECAPPAQTTMF